MPSQSLLAYGVRVAVDAPDEARAQWLSIGFPPGWKPTAGRAQRIYRLDADNGLYADDEVVGRWVNEKRLLTEFENHLKLFVAEHAPRRVFVHAGAVGWKGAGIVIVGSSFSGKTTLVTELVRAGARYYSDEYAVLDAAGRLHPYPRRLSIRRPGQGALRCTAAELGGQEGRRVLPVRTIVLCKYVAGEPPRLESVSGGAALLGMLAHTVPARRAPQRVLDTLATVAAGATVYSGTRGECAAMVSLLLR